MVTESRRLFGAEMNLTIKRTHHLESATLGQLFLEGITTDPIYTLENPERETTKDSRIPSGTYNCKPYSGTKYKDVYIVEGVVGRSAILFHWGNTEKDSSGCILIGNRLGSLNGEPAVLESKRCFQRLRSLIGANNFALRIED
jgi:hypothetical protein